MLDRFGFAYKTGPHFLYKPTKQVDLLVNIAIQVIFNYKLDTLSALKTI